MSELHGKQLWSDKLARSQAKSSELLLILQRDASAGTFSVLNDVPAEVSAGAITGATIDALLGTTSEVADTIFDSTAQGTDAVGFIIDCGGQIDEVISCHWYAGADLDGYNGFNEDAFQQTDLAASTLAQGVQKTTSGHLMGRIIAEGMDANTSSDGLYEIRCVVKLK